ncbi:MAG: hypothetical protein A2X49_15915 [Lentisphaerae bacterium GWF2_52_8]|nr:MAG: hypothetical protein A2X49_15915 [Lentisphaerae bacterium GWF2_52_8]
MTLEIASILFFAVAFLSWAASVFAAPEETLIYELDLSKKLGEIVKDSPRDAVEVLRDEDGTPMLFIRKGTSHCALFPIVFKHDPYKAYRISFTGRVEGPDSLEDNPVLKYLVLGRGMKKDTPSWSFALAYSKDDKMPGYQRNLTLFGYTANVKILNRAWTNYSDTIFIPADAESLNLKFSTAGSEDSLFIKALKIVEVDTSKIINPNWDFSEGELNFTGLERPAEIRKDEDGKFHLMLVRTHVGLRKIPVRPGEKIRISTKGKAGPGISYLGYEYFDADLKKVKDGRWISVWNGSYETTVPAEAAYISWLLANSDAEYVKIERISEFTEDGKAR